MGTSSAKPSAVSGLRAVFGCTYEALAIYRMALGTLLTIELVTRFWYLHPFYSEEGTLPLRLLLPKIDWIYKAVCLHTHLHELWQVQAVLGIQVLAAVFFTIGFQTKFMTILSWYLYLSLTLRNTWLNFILDRYFHYLLFYAMFLPCDMVWSVRACQQSKQEPKRELVVNAGTIGLKCLLFWIYLDAGGGKYMDPLEGWTYHADPLPALDTYTRHTTFARYVYAIMGPQGLRAMTPTVVWVELLAAPLAMLGSFLGMAGMVNMAVGLICQLHVGIALCMNNAALLNFVAVASWAVFLPVGWDKIVVTTSSANTTKSSVGSIVPAVLILGMVVGNVWFAFNSDSCDQVIFYSTIFHCRWNVFIGAEEYVTWEIAPGLLADNSIVDVWGRKNEVDWRLPGAGAPCTSTSRPGRWRSYPYLAELEGEDGEVLWSYLCHQWDRENNVDQYPDRKLIKFNFFMLQADVLPNMGFSATRKRLIYSHECVKSEDDGLSAIKGGSESVQEATTEQAASNIDKPAEVEDEQSAEPVDTTSEEAEESQPTASDTMEQEQANVEQSTTAFEEEGNQESTDTSTDPPEADNGAIEEEETTGGDPNDEPPVEVEGDATREEL